MAAYYGLVGEITKFIEPHTEADPAALVFQFLVCAGNYVGRKPNWRIEADSHHTNLFTVLVGVTSKGRKGTSVSHIRQIFDLVEPKMEGELSEWRLNIKSGLSSGEGLIWAVRDIITKQDRNGESIVVDVGIQDKRLLVVESEFASVLQVMKREGNTLSPVIRQAWDTGELITLTKNSPAHATGAHISIIGHITADELRRHLLETEQANGFANRILWCCVKRSKLLPNGGQLDSELMRTYVGRLAEAVDLARDAGELRRNEEAEQLWCELYPDLSDGRPGMFGAIISRAAAQVMRLAVLYALLDRSRTITADHMRAAMAVWKYAESSAKFIFSNLMGDPDVDTILGALRQSAEGLSGTEISSLFGRHKSQQEIGRALSTLVEHGLANSTLEKGPGRPLERWTSNAKLAK